MKEKCSKKSKKSKKHKHSKDARESKRKQRTKSSSSSSSSESDVWVEKETRTAETQQREDWMSMTGMLKTYTKEDIMPKREDKDKKHIDSYNPSTSTRELNPYWKDGGSGLPQTPEEFRKSRPLLQQKEDDDFYRKPSSSSNKSTRNSIQSKNDNDDDYYRKSSISYKNNTSNDQTNYTHSDRDSRRQDHREARGRYSSQDKDSYSYRKICNWRKKAEDDVTVTREEEEEQKPETTPLKPPKEESSKPVETKYLSDEKMNQLGAKIVKAEIMGELKLVEKLKAKLEAAREYRKQNPDASEKEEDEKVMLMTTNSVGNSKPLTKGEPGDPRSRGGKRKAETHTSGERNKYFGNDDKYNLAQMFEQEKYGNNFDDEAQLAKIAGKHKNPNDDLEDIFMDEISKNRNEAKDRENEKQRAIKQHVKMERSLEGCEYCVESKNMLKHLMVSCGNKVYLALPARRSLVKGHCIITTIQHTTCVTSLDEDVWEEILNFRKALTYFFNSQNKDVVFFETATRLHRFPHMVINCVPLPRDVGDMASIYFKKALLECEAEWSMNKKVVDLKGKNIRKGVPKGLPYFWIDFGMEPGFAHVIEDQQLFPKCFAEEIIGGMLDLDHHLWKNPQKEYGDLQRKKVVEFLKEWKLYDTVSKQNT